MQLPRRIHKKHFLVKINREEQRRKRESHQVRDKDGKTIDIYLAPSAVFMKHNQQIGEIVMRGEEAATVFEQALPGDRLVFSHLIEGSMERRPDKDLGFQKEQQANYSRYLLLEDEEFLYYMVPIDMCYAALAGNRLVMHPDWSLALEVHNEMETYQSSGGLILFNNYENSESVKRQRLKELELEAKELSKTGANFKAIQSDKDEQLYARTERVRARIEEVHREMEMLTRKISGAQVKRFKPQFVPHSFEIDCGQAITQHHRLLYYFQGTAPAELEVLGHKFYLLKNKFIYAVEAPRPKKIGGGPI